MTLDYMSYGSSKVKIDTSDSIDSDKKDSRVSIEYKGRIESDYRNN